mgnify:FL=1|jgi:taurine transport system permease protein
MGFTVAGFYGFLFVRPVPPLALIPLMIIWFGIGETSKVILLSLAALWIMANPA